jgi:anti-anti-sigma factor
MGDGETAEILSATVKPGDGGEVVVVLEGELDLASVEVFTAALDQALQHPETTVTLDWSALTFIDSSGVGAYVQAFRTAHAAGVTLVLGPRSDVVQRVLDLSGVELVLGE